MRSRIALAGFLVLFLFAVNSRLQAAALDSTLAITYRMVGSNIDWTVCGSLPDTYGCYGSGTLGPFGRVGAMIEGIPSQNAQKGTVTRYIYILDVAYGSESDEVGLYVYKRVDTINDEDDTIAVTLYKTVSLPLTGGSATVPSMAANKSFLYVGTNQDELAVQVQKSNLAVIQFGEVSGPYYVTAITSDAYGFITVTWGNGAGFEVLNADGQATEDGGGAEFMLGTVQATLPSTVE
jgi:hypothetical protein